MSTRLSRLAAGTLGRLALAVFALAAVLGPAAGQIITATWTGTSSNWNDPSIWSSSPFFPNNGAPTGAEYNAVLQGAGTITLNVPITIDRLSFASGTIGGAAGTTNSLTMTSGLNWTGGAIGGTINAITPGLTLPGGPQVPVLDTATLTLTGSSFWSGGNLLLQNGAALTNLAGGGIITATGNGTIALGNGAASFNNLGQFIKTAGTGTTTIEVPVANGGTISAQSGTLQFTGSLTNNGTLLASGGNIQLGSLSNLSASGILTGGTYQAQANSTLAMPASNVITTIGPNTTVELDGANSSIPALTGLNTVNGTLTVGAGASLTLNNATKISGTLNVGTGATLNGMQPLTVAGGARLAVQGTVSIPVTTSGVVSGNATFMNGLTILAGGTLSPGNSAGTITVNGNMALNGSYDWELNGNTTLQPGTAFDTVTVTGVTTLDPPAVNASLGGGVDFTNNFWSTPQQWPILTSAGGFSADSVLPSVASDAGGFQSTHPQAAFFLALQGNALAFMWDPGPVRQTTWAGAASGNWSSGSNWATGVVPVSGVNTQLVFGAAANGAMTNDFAGAFILNSMTFNAGSPAYSLAGSGLDFRTDGAGGLPQVVTNSANLITINVPVALNSNLTVGGRGNLLVNGVISGPGSLTAAGTGMLTLTAANTYSGGTVLNSGTVAVSSDAALGSGPLTFGGAGTLSYTGNTTTTRALNLGASGTLGVAAGQTLTLNGNSVTGGFLNGPGTIATSAANGATFAGVTTRPSVTLASNSGADTYFNFTNGGAFNVAANIPATTPVTMSGFTNEGSGAITVGAGSNVSAADFQSYGTLTLSPGTTANPTQMVNTGTSPLFFNGGSRTFISIPSHANPNQFDAGIDLMGKNAVVAGGLFVNNGYVIDSVGAGNKTVVADFGALVKGAGFYQNSVQTVNGGKFQAGNSPGCSQVGSLVIGAGGTTNYNWQIDDPGPSTTFPSAPGVFCAADEPGVGWSGIMSVKRAPPLNTTGNFTWTATFASPFNIILQTLTGASTVGNDVLGPMQNFDNKLNYTWEMFSYQGTYSGPNNAGLDASTIFDLTDGPFANSVLPGSSFHWNLVDNSPNGGHIDLLYVVPEPGTLALTGLTGLGLGWAARRRRR